jgi:hypothetical protein
MAKEEGRAEREGKRRGREKEKGGKGEERRKEPFGLA